jgi:hypothetical protein
MTQVMPLSKGHFGGPWAFCSGCSGMPYAARHQRRASGAPATDRSNTLATPNYSYEKRQRELAKKRKAEEKKQKKSSGRPAEEGTDSSTDDAAPADVNPSPTPPGAA